MVARVVLRSSAKSAQNSILVPRYGTIEGFCLCFSAHQPPKVVVAEAWSAPATHRQP